MRFAPGLAVILTLLILAGSAFSSTITYPTVLDIQQETAPDGSGVILKAYLYVNSPTGESPVVSPPGSKVTFFTLDKDQSSGATTKNILCDSVPASNLKEGSIYYASCTIQKSLYSGGCKDVYADSQIPSAFYLSSSSSKTICDSESDIISKFSQQLSVSLFNAAKSNYLICIVGFVLLGLLLATMYFSGRSPLSILDITTPSLPTPKSLTASGQVLGHLVYGRMLKITQQSLDSLKKVFKAEGDAITKDLARSGKASIANEVKRLAARYKEEDTKKFIEALGLKMVKEGYTLTEIKNSFPTKAKDLLFFSKQEQGVLGQIIQRMQKMADLQMKSESKALQKAGERTKFYADALHNFVVGYANKNVLRLTSGEREYEWGVTGKIQKLAMFPVQGGKALVAAFPSLGKLQVLQKIPGMDRMTLLGGGIGASIVSYVRSMRITGRYGKAVIGTVMRAVKKPTSAQLREMAEKVDAPPGAPVSYLQRAYYDIYTAGAKETQRIGVIMNLDSNLSNIYHTLHKDVHYDMMRYLLKKMYEHHGVNFELSELDITDLAFDYKNGILKRMNIEGNPQTASIVALNKKVRAIFSEKYMPDEEITVANIDLLDRKHNEWLRTRVTKLSSLAGEIGVDFDRLGVKRALDRIHAIANNPAFEDSSRAVQLYDYLVNEHKTNDPIYVPDRNKFYFTVGRDTTTYNRGKPGLEFSDMWNSFLLNNFIFSAENDMLGGEGGIREAAMASSLHIINRMISLNPDLTGKHGAVLERSVTNWLRTQGITDKTQVREYLREFTGAMKGMIVRYLEELMTSEGKSVMDANKLKLQDMLYSYEIYKKGLQKEGISGTIVIEHGSATPLTSTDPWTNAWKAIRNPGSFTEKLVGAYRALAGHNAEIMFKDKNGKVVYMAGREDEMGPDHGWWKFDMKRRWIGDPGRSVSFWTDSHFSKGYKMPYKPNIQHELEAKGGIDPQQSQFMKDENLRANYKRMYGRDILMNELYDHLNGVMGMNSYKYTNETMKFYLKAVQGMLGGALFSKAEELLEEADRTRNATLREEGERIREEGKRVLDDRTNPTTSEKLNTWADRLVDHKDDLQKFMNKPLMYNTLASMNHPWVMTHERYYVPYVDGMPVSDFDRIVNGFVALQDSEGKWRRFDPQRVNIEFGDSDEGLHFKGKYLALMQEKDYEAVRRSNLGEDVSWNSLLKELGEWAKENPERQKLFAAALWHCGTITGNWQSFWEESGVSVRPKHEVYGIRPSLLPYASHEYAPASVMDPWRKFVNKAREVGQWVESTSFYAGGYGGGSISGSFDVVALSSYYTHSWMALSDAIKRKSRDQMHDLGLSDEAIGAYNENAALYWKYQLVWDFGIDRNPSLSSTSHGLQHSLATLYHLGPATTWSPGFYRALHDQDEWINVNFFFNPAAEIARRASRPFVLAFRAFQMNLFGYPNRWTAETYNPMQPWGSTSLRVVDAFRSLVNPFYTALGSKGEMARRDLGGRSYLTGLEGQSADMQWIMKGYSYVGRGGGRANPGEAATDPRENIKLVSPLARRLTQGLDVGQFQGYFEKVSELWSQANTPYVQRLVSPYALQKRREEELGGYGLLMNSIWAWTSPAMFIWHLPMSPISPRDIWMQYKEGRRYADWNDRSTLDKVKQTVLGQPGSSILSDVWSKLSPVYTDERGQVKLHKSLIYGSDKSRDTLACPLCGRPMQRWGSCWHCSRAERRRGGGFG